MGVFIILLRKIPQWSVGTDVMKKLNECIIIKTIMSCEKLFPQTYEIFCFDREFEKC